MDIFEIREKLTEKYVEDVIVEDGYIKGVTVILAVNLTGLCPHNCRRIGIVGALELAT